MRFTKLLTSKKWYWHWENRNRDRPFHYIADGKVRSDKDGTYGDTWSLERRIVLKHGGHYLILIDDQTMRGFFIPTGRKSLAPFPENNDPNYL